MQRMQLWPKGLNPLSFAFWGSVIALPFWLAYLRESHWLAGVVIVADSVFVVLYLRHSCFTWHLVFVANIGFAIYHFAAGRHLTLDITIATALIIYLLLVCQPYFDYIRANATNASNQSLEPTALWRCAAMSSVISIFSTGAKSRSQSGDSAPSR